MILLIIEAHFKPPRCLIFSVPQSNCRKAIAVPPVQTAPGELDMVFATPGGQFITPGNKIEIAGPSRDVGLFLVAPGSPTVAMPVTDLVVNKPHEIIGIIPELPPGKTWTLEVRTQYTQGGSLLKDVRTIASSFTLTEA